MKKIIIIIAAVIVVAVGVVLYLFVFSKEKPEVRIDYSPIEYFTVNVKNSSRYFKVGVVLVVNDEKIVETLTEQNNRIKDTILFILRDLTEEDLKADDTKKVIQDRIINGVNKRLGIDNVVEVLFNEFVMS